MSFFIKQLKVGQLPTNCYLVWNNNEMIVIDPGDEVDNIYSEVKIIGVQVKYIVATHYHYDHLLAVNDLKKFTGAKSLLHVNDKEYAEIGFDRYLRDGESIEIGETRFEIINLPGHTEGSIALIGDKCAFVGDIIFKDGYGRTDLRGGSEKAMAKSLSKLKNILNPGIRVYPGHGEIFDIM